MPIGIHQFRVLPQHVAFLENQRMKSGGAGAPSTDQLFAPASTAAQVAKPAEHPAPAVVYSGAELARTALLMVQCQTVEDIERDTHALAAGLYEQTYDGLWARVGD